ncbi:MAG: hypothetical protein V4636_09075 [Pseudomonadota bacterium]
MTVQTDIGKLIVGEGERDAIHIAVAPVVCGDSPLSAGMRIGFKEDGKVGRLPQEVIGIVDPFLTESVYPGDKFFMFLLPNTITSLRHNWTHPAFEVEAPPQPTKSASEQWMQAWAVQHMSEDYYGDDYEKKRSPEVAYAAAIEAGHTHSIGPYESAREYIDDEWWAHWEAITGERGDRENYFSCAC